PPPSPPSLPAVDGGRSLPPAAAACLCCPAVAAAGLSPANFLSAAPALPCCFCPAAVLPAVFVCVFAAGCPCAAGLSAVACAVAGLALLPCFGSGAAAGFCAGLLAAASAGAAAACASDCCRSCPC